MGHFNLHRKHTGICWDTDEVDDTGDTVDSYTFCVLCKDTLARCQGEWHWHPSHYTHQATQLIYVSLFNPNNPGKATHSSFHCTSDGTLSPELPILHYGPLSYVVHRILFPSLLVYYILETSEGFLTGHWKQPCGSRWFQQLRHTKMADRTGWTQR